METLELEGRGTIAYQITDDGPEIIVLVNGSVFNYHQWDNQALPILRQGLSRRCRFLQYDYIGFGGSSAKAAPINLFDLADELRDLLDALSIDNAHLMGISQGSMVGQAFLIRHPERANSFCGLGNPNLLSQSLGPTFSVFNDRVKALEELKELWPQRINQKNYVSLFNSIYVPAIFSKDYADLSLTERLRSNLVRRMIYPALAGTFVKSIVDLFRYYTSGITKEIHAFSEGLPKVRGIPILLLNGTADTITPINMSRELVQLLPDAELVEFEGITHIGPMMLKKEGEPVFKRYVSFVEHVLNK
jgi:pimeloyl-ACP methyl ester carboxylesterase